MKKLYLLISLFCLSLALGTPLSAAGPESAQACEDPPAEEMLVGHNPWASYPPYRTTNPDDLDLGTILEVLEEVAPKFSLSAEDMTVVYRDGNCVVSTIGRNKFEVVVPIGNEIVIIETQL